MKQVNLTITFDEEKLSALKRYMGKKELDLDREMTDALVKLYEKYVPAPVREYIDESDVSAAAPSKPRRSPYFRYLNIFREARGCPVKSNMA